MVNPKPVHRQTSACHFPVLLQHVHHGLDTLANQGRCSLSLAEHAARIKHLLLPLISEKVIPIEAHVHQKNHCSHENVMHHRPDSGCWWHEPGLVSSMILLISITLRADWRQITWEYEYVRLSCFPDKVQTVQSAESLMIRLLHKTHTAKWQAPLSVVNWRANTDIFRFLSTPVSVS
jgi:hypothetical protein